MLAGSSFKAAHRAAQKKLDVKWRYQEGRDL